MNSVDEIIKQYERSATQGMDWLFKGSNQSMEEIILDVLAEMYVDRCEKGDKTLVLEMFIADRLERCGVSKEEFNKKVDEIKTQREEVRKNVFRII